MLIKRPSDIAPSQITPQGVYLRRREFLAGAASLGLIGTMSAALPGRAEAAPLQAAKSPLSTTGEQVTLLKDITTYNNFYEFGTDKGDPRAHTRTRSPPAHGRSRSTAWSTSPATTTMTISSSR